MKINIKQDNLKIVQITDCHLSYPISEVSKDYITKIIKKERPNFIVFSGDLFHKYHNQDESLRLIRDFIRFIDVFEVNYTYCFGNHDGELTILERDIYKIFITESVKFVGEIGEEWATKYHKNDDMYRDERIGNHVVTLCNDLLEVAKVVVLDSGRYSMDGEYGSLTKEQVKYIDEKLNGCTCPIFMFFHIPLKEHKDLYNEKLVNGTRREDDCNQTCNSGLYEVLKTYNCPVHVFCGHDHINDYTLKDNHITLGLTPGLCIESYNDDDVRGYRVFEVNKTISTQVKRVINL